MRNGSSRRDLLLNSQNFFRSIPAGAKNPSMSRLCYRRLWGIIHSALGYPAFTVGTITGTPGVHPSRSSRTRERSSQCSNAHTRYGPKCLTTF
ncbi:hypothetical protein Lal_00015245 [Lupinus albus]|nr:hypothetical protein Lal_00015245 [Lupinus albus]